MAAVAHPQWSGMNGPGKREAKGTSTGDESLRFRSFTCGRVGYARVSGPLDMAAMGPLRQQVQGLLDNGCRALILDLSGVQFVDSQGVRALLQLRETVEKRCAWLRVVAPQGSPAERTLRLLRFESLFAVFGSAAAAWRRRLPREGRRA